MSSLSLIVFSNDYGLHVDGKSTSKISELGEPKILIRKAMFASGSKTELCGACFLWIKYLFLTTLTVTYSLV